MQNLDWNKCFQRVSDAGLHFPLLFPSSGWHVFVFPLVRPPRTPGEARRPPLSSWGLLRLVEVAEGAISISNTMWRKKKKQHITLDPCFAFNAFYKCVKGRKERFDARISNFWNSQERPRKQRGARVSARWMINMLYWEAISKNVSVVISHFLSFSEID